MARERILVTGAAGSVARAIIPLLREDFSLRLLDRRSVPRQADDEVVRKDIRDLRAIKKACAGVVAVVHLAAVPREDDFKRRLLPVNLEGSFTVFEAARQAKLRKVVFASTGQTVLGYEPDVGVTPEMPVRPVSVYACTKVFGEALARYYSDRHGMSVICLRIGWFQDADGVNHASPDRQRRWCSPRDLAQLIVKSIHSDARFAVLFAVSDNAGRRWSISNAREIVGYQPTDGAPEAPDAP